MLYYKDSLPPCQVVYYMLLLFRRKKELFTLLGEFTMKGRKPNPNRPRYASLISNARAAKGWTQAQLGEAVGKDGTTIKQYEGGKRIPPFDVLYNMCMVLGIDVYDVMDTDLRQGGSTGFREFIEEPFKDAIRLVTDENIDIIPLREMDIGTDDEVMVIYNKTHTGHTSKTDFVLQVAAIKHRLLKKYNEELSKEVTALAYDIATKNIDKNEG